MKPWVIFDFFFFFYWFADHGELFIWGKNVRGCLGIGRMEDQYFPWRVRNVIVMIRCIAWRLVWTWHFYPSIECFLRTWDRQVVPTLFGGGKGIITGCRLFQIWLPVAIDWWSFCQSWCLFKCIRCLASRTSGWFTNDVKFEKQTKTNKQRRVEFVEKKRQWKQNNLG